MADPSMMSLFGDDGHLFPNDLEGLGDCGYAPQTQANPMAPPVAHDQTYGQMTAGVHVSSQAVPAQPKIGPPPTHRYDHFSPYEQQQGTHMVSNGPINGMSSPQSRYHSTPAGSVPPARHAYPVSQTDTRAQAFTDGNGNNWAPPQVLQVSDQAGPPFQQQATPSQHASSGPQAHGTHQMGAYMTHADYSMSGHGQSQQRVNRFPQSLPQEPNHFMGHVGVQPSSNIGGPPGAPSIPHPGQQPQRHPQQFLHRPALAGLRPENMPNPHGAQYPTSPSRHPPSQQVMAGRANPNVGFNIHSQPVTSNTVNISGQYPPYGPYGSINQGISSPSGMTPGMSLPTSSSYPNQGGLPQPQQQRYPPTQQGPMQQPALQQMNQTNAQTMHPGSSSSTAQQNKQHLPPPQGAYGPNSSMSPLKSLSKSSDTPPRPSSTGLGSDIVSSGYSTNAAGSLPLSQRVPDMTHPQVYNSLSPNRRPQGRTPNHELPSQQGSTTDQRLQSQQLQSTSMPFQSSPPPLQQPWVPPQSPQSTPPRQKGPHIQRSPPGHPVEVATAIGPPSSVQGAPVPSQPGDTCDQQQTESHEPQKKKRRKSKVSKGDDGAPVGEKKPDAAMDPDAAQTKPTPKKKSKKPKEPKEPKEPGAPKTPKAPKEKVKTTTPKPKSSKKPSMKKADSDGAQGTKKEAKRKREPSATFETTEKTPPPSHDDEEEEEDDDGVQKRRSSRQVKRKRYTEEIEFKLSEDEDGDSTGPKSPSQASEQQAVPDAEGPIVEKIMGIRLTKTGEESEKEVEEFFVKFKNFSYLHCRWAPLEELEKDKRIHQKVKRFKAKQALSNFLSEMDDEPFNPDYVEVDRVLDVSESTDENGETVTLYLVKWCSLPYEDSTWELKTDVDPSKIEDFDRVMTREPDLTHVERPPASDWVKSDASRDYKNDNKLREYQLEGVNWLLFNWFNTRNCILADEMGLGKTIQSITFLYEIFLKGIHGPFLVIAPLSTIPNWEREFRTWTELNVVVYHGSQASRRTIQTYEMNYRDEQGKVIKGAYKFHAVITTFEMILTDCPELRNVQWRCVVIDEAHRLKNRNCKLLEGLKLMDMEHKVLLTGTPLQNTVEELFSLLNFLEPERFPSESTFMQEFGDLKTEEQVQKLQGILKPMMLRRLKEDVEKNLAPKEETIIEVELTNVQKKYYRAILERNFAFLSKSGAGGAGGGGGGSVPNLLNTMMELRKCCNHPYLINGAEEKILEEYRESHSAEQPDVQLQSMIHAAGKLVLIDKLLPKLKAGGHRVLIFSQMVRCLDILEDYLIQRRYPYERIDGRVRGNLRQAAIDRFSRPDSDRFVFLLCTRAGGLGINLTAADTCIIFDSDWNPQNDLQAQARCHRIGQSKAVKIYRLITRNSYEREMFDKASLKLGLDKAVLQSMSGRENAATGVQQLSKKEIEDLLRKGAYGALMDEEDEGSKFCEEDIDQILMRRTKTITIEAEGVGSTFAKASFVSSGNRTDISLEDPDFWQKWAKKAELDLDAIHGKNNLVIDTPRVRKQTRHYSAMKDDELMEYSDLESDSEDKPAAKPRRAQDRTQGFSRSECFRVEKNLLVYGWGRWRDILSHGRFKRQLTERDVETICRALLAYCLLHYRGDENIKSFVWDLITPTEDGQSRTFSNHSGLSTPVPRGRKGKKGKVQLTQTLKPMADWLADCNPEVLLQEESYKRHLKHHCNKVLLRVRMLYYLRQEVIGDHAERILSGVGASELDIWIPQPFTADVPADWWSSESDKSLLIGVFKHGYEKYNSMRADGSLSFLEHVGMPDPKAIAAEQRGADLMADGGEGEDEDPEYRPLRMTFKDEMDEFTNSPLDEKEEAAAVLENTTLENGTAGSLFWPQASALTARLRRLITAYQRTYKRENAKREALAKPDRRRRQRWSGQDYLISAVSREVGAYEGCPEVGGFLAEGDGSLVTKGSPFFVPEGTAIPPDMAGSFFKERRQRWTRREEADFYRIVSTFGVVYDVAQQRFDWSQFRAFARLDKKTDESLEKYYFSFVAMCKRVCRMQAKTDTELADPTLIIDPITEERASRTLYRIELLRRIREQVLPHPQLAERLRLCQASGDLPSWWECGRHDEELLRGAAKHGVSRTDYHILNDPHFSFLSKARGCSSSHQSPAGAVCTPNQQSSSGLAKDEKVVKVEEGCEEAVVCTSENVKEEQGTAEDVAALSPKAAKQDDDVTQEPEKGPDEDLMQHSEDEQSGPAKPDDKTPPGQSAENVPKVQETGDLVVEDLSTVCKEEEQPEKEEEEEEEEEEEDKEDKVKDDDKSEKSPQAEVGCSSDGKNMDEGSNTSLSTGRDEARDEFCAVDMEGCPPQTLPDRPLIFAFWPKDRIMINRMDNICELVLKGKWPSSRRQLLDFPGVLPGYASTVMTDSPLRRRSLGDVAMTTFKGSGGLSASPAVCKDEALSLSEPRQRRRRRRKVEMEAERSARRRSLMEMVAQLRESHVATTDQNQHRAVVDLTKALHVLPASSSSTGLASSSASDTLTSQRLLGGRPRSLANGSLLDVDLPVQRRRGRRKNVEGLELLFLKNKRAAARAGDCERTNTTEDGSPATKQAQAKIKSVDTVTPGEQDEGEEGGPSSTKDLRAWLKDHPTYTMDMSSYGAKSADLLVPHGSKPKQKRHRCRNPNKIDINTLTGDERVPVVNKRNGRKMGGAMAPPMKDLPRWLMENPEYAVAPDWSEIVKQSGFLPESMFDCLLTGPVVREEGARRRGRRPKSEMAKASAPAQVAASAAAAAAAAAAATAAGVNPLLMNGLFGNMDLTSLQGLQNLQSLQLAAAAAAAGLMGFPQALTGSGDAKHSSSASASMLPLMLPAMGALPNMFNLSSLFGASATAPAVSPSGKNVDEQGATDGKTLPENHDDEANEGDDVKDNVEDCAENKDKAKTSVASDSETIGTNGEAALTAAAAAAASLSANPLAFNPFLLSSMAPGLFYPSMFLPPGLGGLSLPGFPTTSLADLQSAMNATLNTAAPSDDKQISPELSHTDQDEPPPATADTSSVVAEDSESEESQTADQEQDIGEQ